MASRVTATQLVNLNFLLRNFDASQLRCLDDVSVSWLPQLRETLPDDVHGAICKAVEAADCEECCLRRIAWLRCWLLPWQRLELLRFHRLTTAPLWNECLALLPQMAAALRLGERQAPFGWRLHGGALIACLLTEVPELSREHSALYVILWPGRPLLAIHSQGSSIQEQVRVALRAALGYDSRQLGSVRHDRIQEAHRFDYRVLCESLAQPGNELRFPWIDASATSSAASSTEVFAVENGLFSCERCRGYFSSRQLRDWHLWHEHH